MAREFLVRVRGLAKAAGLACDEHYGETRSNRTHAARTDSDALLAREGNGNGAKLSYCGTCGSRTTAS